MESTLKLPDPANTTYLIDASIYVFRAWFGIPDHFFDDFGRPVNALVGYSAFLRRFLSQARPEKVVAAFDESLGSGFRHQLYPGYKANRGLPDDDLAHQLDCCQAFTQLMGVNSLASATFEADDIIATLAKKRRRQGDRIVILSADKDLAQAVSEGDFLWDYHKKKLWSHDDLTESWGFPPARVQDYLALVGDSVDNIPGIEGIGAKTGQVLMSHFDSIDDLFGRLEEVEALPLRGAKKIRHRLAQSQEQAELFKLLTTLRSDVDCSAAKSAIQRVPVNKAKFNAWREEFGLTGILNEQK